MSTPQPELSPRVQRELETVEAMVRLFCGDHHAVEGRLCDECGDLLAFARLRLTKCPFQEDKPTCVRCPIHCYKPDRQAQIAAVMRHAGPRMLLRHPWFTLRHWLDGCKRAPSRSRAGRRVRC